VFGHFIQVYKKKLARTLHQMETFMGKALRDEAVVRLPRISNNAGHGGLRLARRVKSFQAVRPFFNVTNCIAARCVSIHVKAPISFLLRHLLKRYHAMFGLELPQDKVKHQRNPVGEELRPRGIPPLMQRRNLSPACLPVSNRQWRSIRHPGIFRRVVQTAANTGGGNRHRHR